jgi:L-lactate dehydrogenase complex protein LldF
LHCIRCSACLNVCPVYSRTGGHAYGSVYPGPIGAILTPQLIGIENAPTLPFASSLCGACYDACPVKIDIPRVLLHLREQAVDATGKPAERLVMTGMAWTFGRATRLRFVQRLARLLQRPFVRSGLIRWLPPPFSAWTRTRDLRPVAPASFVEQRSDEEDR